jgi:hypothetical protein
VHRHHLRKGNHHNPGLRRAAKKYGPENLIFKKLIVCSAGDLMMFEQRAIDILKPKYNAFPVVNSPLGFRHSQKSKEQMSASKIGIRIHTAEHKAALASRMIGNKFSAGLKLSPERKKAFCEAGRRATLASSFEYAATRDERKSMVADYASISLPALAQKYNIDHRTARRMLQAEGVKIRPRGGRFGEVPSEATRVKLRNAPKGDYSPEREAKRIAKFRETIAARKAKQNGS